MSWRGPAGEQRGYLRAEFFEEVAECEALLRVKRKITHSGRTVPGAKPEGPPPHIGLANLLSWNSTAPASSPRERRPTVRFGGVLRSVGLWTLHPCRLAWPGRT